MSTRARFFIVGAVTAVALVVAALFGIEWQATTRPEVKVVAAENPAFQRLLAERHTIERIDFFGWNAETGTVGVTVRGVRSGPYRFTWEIAEPTHGRMLDSGGRTVTLDPGRRTIIIVLDLGRLAAAYREMVPTGASGGLVKETLRLTASLEPEPSATERDALPPGELQDLASGHSALRDAGASTVPAALQIPSEPAHSTD